MTAIPEPIEYGARPAKRGRRGDGSGREHIMVPKAAVQKYESYYGRNIVKPAPWGHEIPAYLFLGGLAGGSGLLASGGEMSGRIELQRNTRLVALGALGLSTAALVADLGKPARFLNMMRTVKLTSPMSVGSWILMGFGGFTGTAAAGEVAAQLLPKDAAVQSLLRWGVRLASWGAGAFAAPLAAYTGVLLSDTATPTWHGAYRQLPFVFVGSALAASGGAGMVVVPTEHAAPARNFVLVGATLDLVADRILENRIGFVGEPLHHGRAGRLLDTARALTLTGVALTVLGGRRRPVAVVAGACMLVGSACTRFGIFEAGIESAKDPRYTVEPQRARVQARQAQVLAERRASIAEREGLPG